MKTHNIPLESFISHGKVMLKMDNGELQMISKASILNSGKKDTNKHYAYINNKFKLPFRIDIAVKKIDSDMFVLLIGKGHLCFSGGGIRRTDILTSENKPAKYEYDNAVPVNEYVDLSVMYGSKMMWVAIGGKYYYFSDKVPYIRLLKNNSVPAELTEGLDLAISCGHSKMTIKSLTVTEYENDEPKIPAEIAIAPAELSAFEFYVQSLPPEVHDEVIKTDEYLMKDMKNSLKFKRTIDTYGNVTYVSPCRFRYKMRRFDAGELHDMTWLNKDEDYTIETLNKLAEDSPAYADKIFSKIAANTAKRVCGGCTVVSGESTCRNVKTYEYNGKVRKSCGGVMQFDWIPADFEDVRKVVEAVSAVIKNK